MIRTAAYSAPVVHRLEPFEFADPRQGWNVLAGDLPFRRLAWLESWRQAYGVGPNRDAYVLACQREGITIGILPCVRETDLFRGRTVRLLGSGTVCTDYLSLLCEDRDAEEVADSLADDLAYRAIGVASDRFEALEFDGVTVDDRPLSLLAERLVEGGFHAERKPIERSWRLELPESWEAYLASISKSHRKQIRRLTKEWLDSGRCSLREATDEASLTQGLAILADLHDRRRRALGHAGRFADARFATFLSNAARASFREGRLGLYWLTRDDAPVAAEIHFRGATVSYAYQSGLDPAAMDCEPGRLITIALLRKFIDERLEAVDFLRGDEPYKAHFRAEPRELCRLRLIPPTIAARVRFGLSRSRDAVKRWLRPENRDDSAARSKGRESHDASDE